MEFEQALYNRRNISSWADQVPTEQQIDKILQILHDYSPSKQSVIRYKLDVIRNNNKDAKLEIYKGCRCSLFEDEPNGRYNPQVLAPWLFSFSPRLENDQQKPKKPDTWLDIGIAVATVSYAASSLGLDTGLCRCMVYEERVINVLGYRPTQFIGIGYRADKDTYYCPVYESEKPNVQKDPKPEMSEYIKYVYL
jgi:nitroreductase